MDIAAIVQMLAIMAFAMTGIIAVSSRGIDLFSACVLGTITALGGGTIRDLILGMPVFWSLDIDYIWASLAASLLAFVGEPLLDRRSVTAATCVPTPDGTVPAPWSWVPPRSALRSGLGYGLATGDGMGASPTTSLWPA